MSSSPDANFASVEYPTTRCTGVPRAQETTTPLGSPLFPRHPATEGSYVEGVSYERGTPVQGILKVDAPMQLQGRGQGQAHGRREGTCLGIQPRVG